VSATKISVVIAVMRTGLWLGMAFAAAAPAVRVAYVAPVVAGFGAWEWRMMPAPSEREQQVCAFAPRCR